MLNWIEIYLTSARLATFSPDELFRCAAAVFLDILMQREKAGRLWGVFCPEQTELWLLPVVAVVVAVIPSCCFFLILSFGFLVIYATEEGNKTQRSVTCRALNYEASKSTNNWVFDASRFSSMTLV